VSVVYGEAVYTQQQDTQMSLKPTLSRTAKMKMYGFSLPAVSSFTLPAVCSFSLPAVSSFSLPTVSSFTLPAVSSFSLQHISLVKCHGGHNIHKFLFKNQVRLDKYTHVLYCISHSLCFMYLRI